MLAFLLLLASVLAFRPSHHQHTLREVKWVTSSRQLKSIQEKSAYISNEDIKTFYNAVFPANTTNDNFRDKKLINLSFKTESKKTLQFDDIEKALVYLSLPLANYSVLDPNIVQRSVTYPEDGFDLTLPLKDFVSAFLMFNTGKEEFFLKLMRVQARLTIRVQSNPEQGKIEMFSGPIEVDWINHEDEEKDGDDECITGSTLEVPDWLVWGGFNSESNQESTFNLPDVTTTFQPITDSYNDPVEDNSTATLCTPVINSYKASIQPAVEISLEWNPNASSTKLDRFSFLSLLKKPKNQLPVHAKVKLSVDLSIPLKGAPAILSERKAKFFAERILEYFLKIILTAAVSTFSKLTIEDYNQRNLTIS